MNCSAGCGTESQSRCAPKLICLRRLLNAATAMTHAYTPKFEFKNKRLKVEIEIKRSLGWCPVLYFLHRMHSRMSLAPLMADLKAQFSACPPAAKTNTPR